MATLEDLFQIEGVYAVGKITADGKNVEYKAKSAVEPGAPAMTARFCATVSMMFDLLASVYSQLFKGKWVPQQSWTYSGGEMTIVVAGNKVVFAVTAKTDFGKLFKALAILGHTK